MSWEWPNRGETENIGKRSEHNSGGLLVALGGGGLSWERQNRGETENIGKRSEHNSGGLLVAFPRPPPLLAER